MGLDGAAKMGVMEKHRRGWRGNRDGPERDTRVRIGDTILIDAIAMVLQAGVRTRRSGPSRSGRLRADSEC